MDIIKKQLTTHNTYHNPHNLKGVIDLPTLNITTPPSQSCNCSSHSTCHNPQTQDTINSSTPLFPLLVVWIHTQSLLLLYAVNGCCTSTSGLAYHAVWPVDLWGIPPVNTKRILLNTRHMTFRRHVGLPSHHQAKNNGNNRTQYPRKIIHACTHCHVRTKWWLWP